MTILCITRPRVKPTRNASRPSMPFAAGIFPTSVLASHGELMLIEDEAFDPGAKGPTAYRYQFHSEGKAVRGFDSLDFARWYFGQVVEGTMNLDASLVVKADPHDRDAAACDREIPSESDRTWWAQRDLSTRTPLPMPVVRLTRSNRRRYSSPITDEDVLIATGCVG